MTLLILVTTLASLAVDPDEMLRIVRRLSFRSALTASLATRMIPVLAADAQRLAEAQRTRPQGAPRGARGRVALLRAVVGGSLDRAMDVAATLEVRGFASARRAPRLSRSWSRHDIAFAAPRARCSRLALLGTAHRRRPPSDAYPMLHVALGGGHARAVRGARSARRCCRSRSSGDRPMTRPVLAFEQVTYRYPSMDEPALRDVSLEIVPGEFCLLAGLSGHGKSTLLRAACGLVPHFHGGRFAGPRDARRASTRASTAPPTSAAFAGVLFQDPETQLVMSTVRAELALALESRGHSAAAVARGVEEVALALGIDALLDRASHELSGGEKQRVALGAALAGRPRVVLLDEPTSQLDPVAGDELIGLLRRLNQEWETTIVLAEHRLERCLTAADRVIALDRGRRRVRRRSRRSSCAGRANAHRRCRRRARSCSRSRACVRSRSA